MFQKYEPLFAMESAMGPTVPMLFPGPLRRIKLTGFPGVVTVHYTLLAKAFRRDTMTLKHPPAMRTSPTVGRVIGLTTTRQHAKHVREGTLGQDMRSSDSQRNKES